MSWSGHHDQPCPWPRWCCATAEVTGVPRRPPGQTARRGKRVTKVRARGLDTVVRLPDWPYKPSPLRLGGPVHVVPSREESWSQSTLVALGLGVPVVGTAVDGPARTLGNGRGVLVPPDDPHALAAALWRVLGGQRPDPGPGRAYAWQFTPRAAVCLDAYRHLRASGQTLPPGDSGHPAASSPAATDTRT
jgi:hypothetical protein